MDGPQNNLPAIYNIGRLYRTGSGAIGLLLGGGRRVLKENAESLKCRPQTKGFSSQYTTSARCIPKGTEWKPLV